MIPARVTAYRAVNPHVSPLQVDRAKNTTDCGSGSSFTTETKVAPRLSLEGLFIARL